MLIAWSGLMRVQPTNKRHASSRPREPLVGQQPPRRAFSMVPSYSFRVVAVIAALALSILLPAAAHAGVVSITGPDLTFTAAPGEVNDVRAEPQPNGVLFTDASAPLTAGSGC